MPKRCVFCEKRTDGIPTFQVTTKRIDKWASVIPRKLKIGDRICQHHFSKEEIGGVLTSRNEQVRTKAKLKAGAIPKIVDKSNPYESDVPALPLSPQSLQVKQNKIELRQYRNKYKKYRSPDIENKTNLENCSEAAKEARNSICSFEQIASDPHLINLPSGWCRTVPENNKSIVFCKVLLKEENFLPYVERSVVLNNLSTVNCTYIDYFINPAVFSMSLDSNLTTNKLQDIVNKMASVNMCLGVDIPIELQQFKSESVITDIHGKFRHYSCLIVNDCDNTTQCAFCRTLLSTFNRKKSRSKAKNTKKVINLIAVPPVKIKQESIS